MIKSYLDEKPQVDAATYIADTAEVIGRVEIAKKVSIWPLVVVRGDMDYVKIGECSNIQDGTVVHVDTDLPCVIGSHVTIGHNATVHACVIEDNCLIGMGSIILDGAVIGNGSIIGAGSVVPPGKVIPPNSLVMGIPAKIVKEIDGERVAGNITHAEKYWNLAKTHFDNQELKD